MIDLVDVCFMILRPEQLEVLRYSGFTDVDVFLQRFYMYVFAAKL